jgi:hypothetical protein
LIPPTPALRGFGVGGHFFPELSFLVAVQVPFMAISVLTTSFGNSDSLDVVKNSIKILTMHAHTLDYLQQPQSTWAVLELHGGKCEWSNELITVIGDLPANIRTRLVLENDEYSYSAAEILWIAGY